MDTRKLVFGDCIPLIRDGIDVLRLAIVAGAVGFWLAGAGATAPTASIASSRPPTFNARGGADGSGGRYAPAARTMEDLAAQGCRGGSLQVGAGQDADAAAEVVRHHRQATPGGVGHELPGRSCASPADFSSAMVRSYAV
jgi:hypothetical protein